MPPLRSCLWRGCRDGGARTLLSSLRAALSVCSLLGVSELGSQSAPPPRTPLLCPSRSPCRPPARHSASLKPSPHSPPASNQSQGWRGWGTGGWANQRTRDQELGQSETGDQERGQSETWELRQSEERKGEDNMLDQSEKRRPVGRANQKGVFCVSCHQFFLPGDPVEVRK